MVEGAATSERTGTVLPGSLARGAARLIGLLRRHPYLVGLVLYASFTALIFRDGGIGSPGSLPEGTNALNTWMVLHFFQAHPGAIWLYPFTDWGQPYGGFTGPTLLTPLLLVADPTTAVRGIEFGSFVAGGLGLMAVVRSLGGTTEGAFLAGFYYSVMAETGQFFEGHVPAMISVALAPPFLFLLWRFLRAPSLLRGVLPVVLLYLLISIGDLGMLYFYVFFGVLIAGFTIVARYMERPYRWPEIASVIFAALSVVVLTLTWLVPFALGVRPEYTTNITVQVVGFRSTTGENLVYAYAGYLQDHSFLQLTYHQFAFGPGGSLLLPFSLIIPLAVTGYVVARRSRLRLSFFGSAILAMIFATGKLYPGLSSFNSWVYYTIPDFDANAEVFRWNEYGLLVFGILLGLLVSDLQRDSRNGFPGVRSRLAWIARRLHIRPRVADAPDPETWRRWGRPRRRAAILALGATAIMVLVVAQNWVLVSEPLATFEFPSDYTASFGFLEDRPVSGEVLAVPFGGIYDRTPWGGISTSAALLTSSYTGVDTDIFEAGTPYSLAIDQFLSEGLTYGGSRNVSKFLGSANVEFVVATRYTNWSYSSSSVAPPSLSYYALANQTGLGPETNISNLQSVYQPGNWAGNVSFHPSFLIYFGALSSLYSVLDSAWYPGPSMALVNGSALGSSLSTFIEHAAGIVVDAPSLGSLGVAGIAEASKSRVPIIEVVPPSEFIGNGTQLRADPWNATGGVDLQFDRANATASINLSASLLTAAGYGNLTLSGQAAGPPGAVVRTTLGGAAASQSLPSGSELGRELVNYSATGYVSIGQQNLSGNYSGNITSRSSGNVSYLNWTPNASAKSFQYVQFGLQDLEGWNGLSLTVYGNAQIPLEARIAYGNSYAYLPGYATLVPTSSNAWRYWFLYPSGGAGMPDELLDHLNNVTSVEIGLPAGGFNRSVLLSNLSLEDVSWPRLASVSLGLVPVDSTTLGVSLPPTGRLGFLEVSTGAFPTSRAFQRDLDPQPDSPTLAFASSSAGWGILTLAQTYSPEWQLTGPMSPAPVVVDIGLTGWLVNSSVGSTWHIRYLGQQFENLSVIIEVVALPIVAAPVVYVLVRPMWVRHRRGRVPQ